MSDPTSPAASPEWRRRTHSHRWTAPLSPEDRQQLHEEASHVLKCVCEYGNWMMSVPVRETDADMVMSAVVRDAELLAESCAAERDTRGEVLNMVHEALGGTAEKPIAPMFFDDHIRQLRAERDEARAARLDAEIRAEELAIRNTAHEVTIASLNERLPEFVALHHEAKALRAALREAQEGRRRRQEPPRRALRKPLSRKEALAYRCAECGAEPVSPCIDTRSGSYGRPIKGVHDKRQFPFGMYDDAPLPSEPSTP